MRPATVLALLLSCRVSNTAIAQEENTGTSSDLDVNFLTASFECSHHSKEWHICTQPDGWGSMFYCPAYSEYNETKLQDIEWGSFGKRTPLTPCFTCPGPNSTCSVIVTELLAANNIAQDQNSTLGEWSIADEAMKYCEELCESNKEGEACSQDRQCTPGALFCDYAADDSEDKDGKCKRCPTNPDQCFEGGFATSVQGRHNCRDCRLFCYGAGVSSVWIEGEHIWSQPMDSAIQASHIAASGPMHDCSNLILDPKATCRGAEGKICLIEYTEQFAIPWQVSNQAEQSGCVGVLAFIEPYDGPMSNSNSKLMIPYVYIPIEEGRKLLKNKIGAIANIQVDMFGAGCYPAWESNMCSATWSCNDGHFCEFNSVPTENESDPNQSDLFSEGYCRPCPENPMLCYFDDRKDGISDVITVSTKTVQKVQTCAASCGAELTSDGCKFCTSQVTGFEFGVENEEDQCILCPQYDVQYPDRIVPLFGDNVTCWQLESFFKRLPVPKDSRNCQIAQSMNFICGCDGTGYAGANTQTKQAVLAWLPRVAAIASIVGSSFIIYDTQRTRLKRTKVINKILCTISVFDVMGSLAMALTTLPMPEMDYIYGSKGSKATCTAQGFFIQMGTIACLLGSSLALYYNLTIKQGWSDSKLKRKHLVYFLFIPPIMTGFAFAGAGIPYYDNVFVWCNNSARWWPEVPIILAILCTTVIMGDVVSSVYKKERASSRYSLRGNRLAKMVFKQAMWFVAAFYLTWVPYLTLQFMWSSGTGYDIYGLSLAAATLVPLQGFLNCVVYCKPRYFKKKVTFSVSSSIISGLRRVKKSIRFSENNYDQTRGTTGASQTGGTVVVGSVKSLLAKNSWGTFEEEGTFRTGTPNKNEPVVPFGVPDMNASSGCNGEQNVSNLENDNESTDNKEHQEIASTDNKEDRDTVRTDSKHPVLEGNKGDQEQDEDSRFDMLLAG